MIKKQREKSHRLLTHEAAMRRVPKNHPKYSLIEKEHGRLFYGHKGEDAMDYFLTYLPDDKYFILNSLRLEDPKGRFFQMDTVLLSQTHCIIVDSKYINGVLEFDQQANQLIRHLPENGGLEKLSDPISQTARQRLQLGLWLEKHNFPPIPIASLIALTHTNTTLIKTTPSILKKVTFHTNLPNRIQEINSNHRHEQLSKKDLLKLSKLMIKKHTPDKFNLLSYYNIEPHELILGVICTSCKCVPMQKKRSTWHCFKCGDCSKVSHLEALSDHKLLIGNIVTNKEIRWFLQLPSPTATSKYLSSLNLRFEGDYKGRRYFL
ncbi:nuclease-related domain-containing protein [Bacillus sp. RO1]|uniref:nuclease-related domain-containing protein n=1 Tax=Bacillus sp. RO1 TaxID=2722703 RepID=UPI001456363C|nr:nuclease-related domain-containing protein [Bacillus sp. RO1]NLP51345.1 NERD domain-containing protein [Bacillus sp. RO1]